MAASKLSKKAQLADWLAGRPVQRISEADAREIALRLAPISDKYLQTLLRGAEIPLAPLVEGVRQESLDEAERTLLALEQEYRAGRAAGDPARAEQCRRAVILAKEHARFAATRLRDEERRRDREEMIEWMVHWLEHPAAFPSWIALRRRALTAVRPTRPE